MKILFLTQRLPYPPNRGDRIRAYHFLKHLSRTHTLHVGSLLMDRIDKEGVKPLVDICEKTFLHSLPQWRRVFNCLLALFSGKSFSCAYFYSGKLKKKIKEAHKNEKYDMVFISSSSMAQYVDDLALPALVDFVDADSKKWEELSLASQGLKKFIFGLEHRRIKRLEKQILEQSKLSIVTTEQDKNILKRIVSDSNIEVVQNGVDVERFRRVGTERNGKRVLFVGMMNYEPNIDAMIYFTKDIWPLVIEKCKDATLQIVGANPVSKVRKLDKLKGVSVVGTVEDVVPYYEKANVFIAPLRMGRGVQNKILEAMAMELPVVTTNEPCQAIGAAEAEGVISCEDSNQFAEDVIELLDNEEQRIKLGASARNFVERNYSWDRSANALNKAIDYICQQ